MTNTSSNIGSVITDPAARKAVYATFVVLGFLAGGVTVAFGVIGDVPQWVNVMNAVLAFASASGVAGLAVANVTTAPSAPVEDADL